MTIPETDVRGGVDALLERAAAAGVPAAGAFEVTSRCNLACRMCYIRHGAGDADAHACELPAATWVALAEAATQAGMLFLLLTGGEPFLRPDFLEIYRPLTEFGLHLTIYTNATLVTPALVHALGQRPPSRVGVTLYGASPATYEAITGSREAFSQALRGIDLLLEASIPVAVRTTLTQRNVQDREGMRELARARGLALASGWLLTCRPHGAPSSAREDRLSPTDVVALESADPALRERWQAPLRAGDAEEQGRLFCHAGRAAFVVSPAGEMNPCLDLPVAKARPLAVGFGAAWECVRGFVQGIPPLPECRGCAARAYCGTCPAAAYAETGSLHAAASYYCAIAHERRRVFGGSDAGGRSTP